VGPRLITILLEAAAFTAKEAAVGFALGAVLGFALGVLLAHFRVLLETKNPKTDKLTSSASSVASRTQPFGVSRG